MNNVTRSIDPNRFHTATLAKLPRGPEVRAILAAALDAVDPYTAVRRVLALEENILVVGDRRFDLSIFSRVWVVGAGKAAYMMGLAVEDSLDGRLHGGVLMTKEGYLPADNKLKKIVIREAGHPVPDERGEQVAAEIAALLAGLAQDDLVICLLSGGGSALLTAPAGDVTLADLRDLTGQLLRCGADIGQMNTLRKHLETLKGGGLARLAAPAAVAALVLSDVVGDPLDVIASGPTMPDPTTFSDAWAVLERFDLQNTAPGRVLSRLQAGQRGEIPDTAKPGDMFFDRVSHVLTGSNYQAASAAAEQARSAGLNTLLLTTFLQGEARSAGQMLAALARQVAATGEPVKRPACLIAGGETTVTVRGPGMGGRNQELALGSVEMMAGLKDALLVALATDGGDGPTGAAGAVVSGETLARSAELGLFPANYLERNDAYTFFDALDDLLTPGPTLTNVNDLALLFLY